MDREYIIKNLFYSSEQTKGPWTLKLYLITAVGNTMIENINYPIFTPWTLNLTFKITQSHI